MRRCARAIMEHCVQSEPVIMIPFHFIHQNNAAPPHSRHGGKSDSVTGAGKSTRTEFKNQLKAVSCQSSALDDEAVDE